MVERWHEGDRDPLGNPLRLCGTAADCPYPCPMTFPHLHSIVVSPVRLALQGARDGLLAWNAMGFGEWWEAAAGEIRALYEHSPEIQAIDRALDFLYAARKVDER